MHEHVLYSWSYLITPNVKINWFPSFLPTSFFFCSFCWTLYLFPSLSLYVLLLSCPFIFLFFFRSSFSFPLTLNRSFFFVSFLLLPYVFLIVSIFFSNFIFFCSSFLFLSLHLLPPPRLMYFRYSSANECIKIPANRERKLRKTSVWTPSSHQASNGGPFDHKAGM